MRAYWRLFGIDDQGVLHSPVTGALFPLAVITAACPIAQHVPPAADCSCGVYAITNEAARHQLVRCSHNRIGPSSFRVPGCRQWRVLAEIDLTGTVLPDPYANIHPQWGSVRAAGGRILRLHLDKPGAKLDDLLVFEQGKAAITDRLEQRYRVPVTTK